MCTYPHTYISQVSQCVLLIGTTIVIQTSVTSSLKTRATGMKRMVVAEHRLEAQQAWRNRVLRADST